MLNADSINSCAQKVTRNQNRTSNSTNKTNAQLVIRIFRYLRKNASVDAQKTIFFHCPKRRFDFNSNALYPGEDF